MSETFAFPVVSLIVENAQSDGVILLQLRSKAEKPGLENLYELPQGRLRAGESITDCARRELQEETGLDLLCFQTALQARKTRSEELTSVRGVVVSETGQHSYLAVCLVCTAAGNPRGSLESSEPRWYSKAEVLTLIADDQIYPLNVPMILAYYEKGV